MSPALQKTLSILLLIGVGLLLKRKLRNREELGGIKMLILSIALPATIFIALLKIRVEAELLVLPLMALAFNLIMFAIGYFIIPLLNIEAKSSAHRTLMMLFPSLAPGLSCFPFLVEYLGDESLAWAALADVGNKVFGLIILYIIAMNWYYRRARNTQNASGNNKLKGLLLSLVKEPINMVMVVAILLLSMGLNLASLPEFMQQSVRWMSNLMTPMVLLFIGMAVQIKKGELRKVICLLLWRSGLAFLISAFALSIAPELSYIAMMVIVVMPQSATSFWPFAHMSAVNTLENDTPQEDRTFNLELALTVLAFSLPFSTVIIMSICSIGEFFVNPLHLLGIGAGAIILGSIPVVFNSLSQRKVKIDKENTQEKKLTVELASEKS